MLLTIIKGSFSLWNTDNVFLNYGSVDKVEESHSLDNHNRHIDHVYGISIVVFK